MTKEELNKAAVLVCDGMHRPGVISGLIKGLDADFDGDRGVHIPGLFVIPKKFRKHAKRRAKASHKRSRAYGLWF